MRSIRFNETYARGTTGISEAIVREIKDKIKLRVAEEKDIDNTFMLTTQEDIRKVSFSGNTITPENHREWFHQKRSDRNCLFLIAEAEGSFMGQIRFDIKGNEAVVSISLLESYRGMGAGQRMFHGGLEHLISLHPEVSGVTAYIKNSNSASIDFFSSLEFKHRKTTKINDIDALEYHFEMKEAK